jgi:hypothetical protein
MICVDEFAMADEAFALSPIAARAARPSEEDYDAISEAFMETSRGRWFLGEYARRNRNADTRMVLDAVARIEENLSAQRSQTSESDFAEALAAIRSAVEEARSTAKASLDALAPEQTLAPIRKGARVIREISWRLREIGADSRICDLIDSQVGVIEGACGPIASADPLSALGAAFDVIEGRIAEFDDIDAVVPEAVEEVIPAAAPTQPDEMAAATEATINAVTAGATKKQETTTDVAASPVELAATTAEALERVEAPEAVEVTAEEMTAEGMEAAPDVAEADADAHDEAVLEMIAFEMAAPDPSDSDDDAIENRTDETDAAQLAVADLEIIPRRAETQNPEPPAPEQIASPRPARAIQLLAQPPAQPAPETSFAPSPEPSRAPEPSLGSSLIANGIVRRPKASMPDPLAPIRRMSQTEKIAFFS